MNELGSLLRKLRGNKSLRTIGEMTGLSHSYIADMENGFRRGTKTPLNPSAETLKRLSKAYNYDYNELLKLAGYLEEEPKNETTDKDEKDIAKRMEQIRKDLTSEDGLSFNGEPMSEEAVDSLLEAMEYAVRTTQRINKKYIPKKHRKNTDE